MKLNGLSPLFIGDQKSLTPHLVNKFFHFPPLSGAPNMSNLVTILLQSFRWLSFCILHKIPTPAHRLKVWCSPCLYCDLISSPSSPLTWPLPSQPWFQTSLAPSQAFSLAHMSPSQRCHPWWPYLKLSLLHIPLVLLSLFHLSSLFLALKSFVFLLSACLLSVHLYCSSVSLPPNKELPQHLCFPKQFLTVYVYICIHVHRCIYVHKHICVYVCVCMCVHKRICVRVCMCARA